MYIFTPPLVAYWKTQAIKVTNRFLPLFIVIFIFFLYRFNFPTSPDAITLIVQLASGVIFISFPSVIYSLIPSREDSLTWIDILNGLWVWLPIEFNFIDDFLGPIELGNLSFDILLALFAFLYALIFIRNHEMGLNYSFNYKDFKIVLFVLIILMVIILPFGIGSSFLATPDIIYLNFLTILNGLPISLIDVILTFISIFLGIALIEEMFFRGFIYRLLVNKLEKENLSNFWVYGSLFVLVFLIAIIPWIDNIFTLLSNLFPVFSPIKTILGSLAEPLGSKEGQEWLLVKNIPLEILYILVALLIGVVAFIIIFKTHNPILTALILSSILFGWAHFEDLRYIFFATIAGFGYGWTYEKSSKIVPAALVHMAVDGIWSLLLSF